MRRLFSVIKWTTFTILVGIALLFIKFSWSLTLDESNATKSVREASGDKAKAISACQLAIEETLKNPKSVEWVDRFQWPSSFDQPLWTIQATYRATNSFNAIVTESVICETLDGTFAANLVR